MNLILACIAVVGTIWLFSMPERESPMSAQQTAHNRQLNEYGLRAYQKRLRLHDDIASRLVEIHALEMLEMEFAATPEEARQLAEIEVAEHREMILDSIEMYESALDRLYGVNLSPATP